MVRKSLINNRLIISFCRIAQITSFLLVFHFSTAAQDTRSLNVTYTCYLTNLPATKKPANCWIPVPVSNERQIVDIVQADLAAGKITTEKKYGNSMYYRSLNLSSIKTADTIFITLKYKVRLSEKAIAEAAALSPLPKTAAMPAMEIYLSENRLIPLKGAVTDLTNQLNLPAEPIPAARKLYDYLIDTMVYNYKAPGAGRGDVIWACTNKTGDCSDYNAIFIGVSRASGIPADHVFGIPLKKGKNETRDWHCWARFWVKGPGWITIDASEAAKHPELLNYNFGTLSNTYLTLTHGRDVMLEPAQKSGPLNIFADPYLEIDGKKFDDIKWVVNYEETK